METFDEFLEKLAEAGMRLSVEEGQLNCYAPQGKLTPFFRDGIARYRTEIIGLLERRKRPPAIVEDHGRSESRREFPLSVGQKGLYILQKLYPAMSAYNVPLGFRIKHGLDATLLDKAWGHVLDRYPILTARIVERDGGLYQRLDDACRTTIQHRIVAASDDQDLLSILKARAKQPFDPNQGPLTRVELLSSGGQEATLLLTVHHLVIDGTSTMIVLRSLLEFYKDLCEKKPESLGRDLPGYGEFVAWEEAMLSSPEGEAHADYWRKQLGGELPVLELAPDRPGSSSGFEGRTLVEELPGDLGRWVRDFGSSHSLPPSVVFLALFQLLLHRYTDLDDIIVGMPVMGRAQQRFAADVGYFINMIPLRTRCDGQLKLKDFFRRVQATMLDGLFHSSYPFPLMLAGLQVKEVRKDPVFQVTYAYQNFIKQDGLAPLLQELALDIASIPELAQEGESDLGLEVFEEGQGFSVKLKFNPALFSDRAAHRLFESYCALLKEVSEDGDRALHEYSILSGPERQRVLVDFNDTRVDFPAGDCLHDLFVAQVARSSGKMAVDCNGERLTYQHLHERSRDLALYLQSLGVVPDTLVGVCLGRSVDMLVAILGVLMSGGAYVPLDPEYPDERLAFTLEDCRASILLTQESLLEKLSGLAGPDRRVLAVDEKEGKVRRRVAELKARGVGLAEEVRPHHLAYVIYTSGSTGRPKGVAIEHHSPVTLVRWALSVYTGEELSGVLASTSICFDLSIFEMFVTLSAGGTILLAPNALGLADLPNREAVTLINTVPSAMEELVRANAIPDSVQTVNLAGELLSPRLVDRVYDNSSVRKVYDLYGPSEDTTYSTFALRTKDGPKTIGRPVANTQVFILDAQRNPQPIGVPGEAYIAGDGLARGYLHRPELTQERFVANPFEPGARMYRTGDRARWLEDGTIQYLGRIDNQVKLRGYRIEIGEVEVRLCEHGGIQDCAVVAQGEGAGGRLVAFYCAKGSTPEHIATLPTTELRGHLLKTLPEYMVPTAFVSLAAIPLNLNGKVDRRALTRMDAKVISGCSYVAPRNETERSLVEMWADVLGRAPESIGVDDGFFDMGGHSLLATQLVSKIRNQLGVNLPLKAIFEQTTVARLAVLVGTTAQNEIPPIRPIDRSTFERLPLSFAEERVWFMNQMAPEGATLYSVPGAFLLYEELNLDHMDEAFNLIIARHESLRTVFPIRDGQPERVILDHLDFRFARTDLRCCDRDARDTRAREICLAEARRPFDVAVGPLIRGNVITLAEREHIVLVNTHHIISDGWSIGVFVKEARVIIQALREGRRPELPELPIQYVDYSVWQRQWLEEGGLLKQQLAYWQKKLASMPESLDLVTDYPRPSVRSVVGATSVFTLDAQLTSDLKRLAERHGGTLYMVLLAAFKTLLYRYTGQTDICVGSPIANRNYGEIEGLIGMFVNTLALRSRLEGNDGFSDVLATVRATCLEAYENQDAPFPRVVDAMHLPRNTAINPLFQIMFILQSADAGGFDQRIQRDYMDTGYAKYDITVELIETASGLEGAVEYTSTLFRPETIERMVRHFVTLCRAVVEKPAARICDIDYMSEAERGRMVAGYSAERASYPEGRCLHELFTDQARRTPEAVAIICGTEELTYEQLHARSRDLALFLQSESVGPDSLVGLCMDRSLEMVIGMLGILQAGGAYVPLDPHYPDARLAYMLRDTRAAIVLTQEKLREQIRPLVSSDTKLVAVDREADSIGGRVAGLRAAGATLRGDVQPHHLAYVIYTSGSTGQPKGVAIEHHSPVTLVDWAQEVYSRQELAGVLAATSVCFDLSVFEIFVTLASGGTILLAPNALGLVDLPRRDLVTLINTVPSAMEELVRMEAIPDSVITVNLAGEPLLPPLVDKVYAAGNVKKVYDLYGPSEATTYSTYALRKKNGPQTIGRPIVNTQVHILDDQKNVQPVGVPGEVYIAGDGLARGYLYRPELTQEKFVVNPFEPGTRMYKTGDRARWLDDGSLQYLGRIDTQVKIRGFRIELGEIESRLSQCAGILDSAVVAKGEGAARQLVAFYRAEATTPEHLAELPVEALREQLLRTLPDYMVPAAFVSIPAIPLNSSGKIDRRALEQMDVKMTSRQEFVAPRDETEKELVAIWADVLKLPGESLGVEDNFFELGGHSLLATRLISKIRSQLGVNLPLKAIFEQTTVAQLAVSVGKAAQNEIPPIRSIDRSRFERLPLSFAEERVWFMNLLAPESTTLYSVPGAFVVLEELNLDHMDEAFNLIIARHESLRTVFPIRDGQPERVILDHLDFQFVRTDLSHRDKETRDARAKEICLADVRTPLDLAVGPLIRGNVITLAEREHIVLVNTHHIISDGWSMGVFVREFRVIMEALRDGRRPELPELPIQYVDYSIWQRRLLEEGGGLLKQQLAYWQKKLASMPESLDLVTDYPRLSVRSVIGATCLFTFDAQLTSDLKRLSERHGGTLYMVLLAAFKTLLYRYTGQTDICVGSPIANRNYGETEGLIGMFVNTLALRSRLEGNDRFSDVLATVRATCLEAYENQDAPFPQVVDVMHLPRSLATSPLFQIMFILQSADTGGLDQKIQRDYMDTGYAKYDITVELIETANGLDGAVEYSSALFKPETIERMVRHFVTLCRAVVGKPAARICDIDYMSEAERGRMVAGYSAERANYPEGRRLHELFTDQTRRTPEAVAIVCGTEELTYEQLHARSRDLALYLQSESVGPDSLVGLCMDRSLEMVISMLGILQAGGAYVPLDPHYPDARLAYMLQDTRAAIVLTQERLRDQISPLVSPDTKLVAVDREAEEIGGRVAGLRAAGATLRGDVRPHHLAYVIYTSGSTGQPKGVAIEHHSPVTLVDWALEVYSRQELAGVLAATSVCFDLSVFEIFVTLASGGTILLAPNALGLVDLPRRDLVTLINTVPSAMEELVRMEAIPDSVITVNLAGEPLLPPLVDKVYAAGNVKKVYDLYGPSEATTYSTYALRKKSGPQTIGRPIVNTQVHILDDQKNVQPVGVPGEVYIAGDGLARGYLYRPKLTQERFVVNPFEPGTRMYKTGDRARWLDDGSLQYLGRIDTQVKVRGFRIELGEIESRLSQCAGILDSAVVAKGEGAARQLVAFYRAEATTPEHLAELPVEALREQLLRTLPDYMVPAAFVSIPAIPLNSSGKIDRRALEQMDVKMTSRQEFVAPRDETEKELVAIWADVLRLPREGLGVEDDFFELGGHSLSSVQLISRINKRFNRALSLSVVFTSPTVADFAKLLSTKAPVPDEIVVPIQVSGDAQPIFGIPGAGGVVLSLLPLSRALGPRRPFYGLQAVGLDGRALPLGSVEETAKANIAAVKKVQPQGPYNFIGHSYGGVVAFEMARVLLEAGEEVASLTFLDSLAPWVVQEETSRDAVVDLREAYAAILKLDGAKPKPDEEPLPREDDGEKVPHLLSRANEDGHNVDERQFAAFEDVFRVNLDCYRGYKPSVLPQHVDVSLYRATGKDAEAAARPGDYGWNRLLKTPVRVHDVEGDHYSILERVPLHEFRSQTVHSVR